MVGEEFKLESECNHNARPETFKLPSRKRRYSLNQILFRLLRFAGYIDQAGDVVTGTNQLDYAIFWIGESGVSLKENQILVDNGSLQEGKTSN